MLLAPRDARRFMVTYERVAMAVHVIAALDAPASPQACLAKARKTLQDTPGLLDEAVAVLQKEGFRADEHVVKALQLMQLGEWIHLKDLSSGAIFLNREGTEAYCAIGLTQQPSAIIGSRGFLVETALCSFAGRILCDGVFIPRVQLGPNLWSECQQRYLSLKAAGRLHRSPASVPAWDQPRSQPTED